MIADTYGAGMPGAAVDDGERRDHTLIADACVLELLGAAVTACDASVEEPGTTRGARLGLEIGPGTDVQIVDEGDLLDGHLTPLVGNAQR